MFVSRCSKHDQTMKNPFRYLKDNWLKYGFETAAIIVGILGAFSGADKLIISQLGNNDVRFTLHNMMAMRGRTSTL